MNNSRPKIYVNRSLESEILKYLKDPEIIAIMGPRQCGKTTLLKHFCAGLKNTEFITFESIKELQLFDEDIDAFIKQHVEGYDYLFIDEFQYSEQGGRRLKYIYDTQEIKIFIIGSSSVEISVKGLKYLAGRVLTFNLYPFSFEEFLQYKDSKLSLSINTKPSAPLTKQAMPYLKEFVTYGGYPRIVLEENNDKKEKLLQEIYNVYMLKEIGEIFNISNRKQLASLLEALAANLSSLLKYKDFSDITGYNHPELKEKLGLLQETFICRLVRPFYTNKRTELVKNPKIFFLDNGLLNSITGNHNVRGELYENFVFSEIVKRGMEPKYWRSKSKAEVDFIIKKGNDIFPIEVKSHISREKLTKSYISFLDKYSPRKGFFLSPEFISRRVYKESEVLYYPFPYVSKVLEVLA